MNESKEQQKRKQKPRPEPGKGLRLYRKKTWICTGASLMSWSPCCAYMWWGGSSWAEDMSSLSSFPVCLSRLHLGAKGTKWDSLRANVALSFSLSWATQSPMSYNCLCCTHQCSASHYLSLSLSVLSAFILAFFLLPPPSSLGFWLFFHPFFLFIHIHFLLITDYQLCRTSL